MEKKCGQDILFILVTMYNLYIANRNMKKKPDVLAVSAFRVYSGKLPENFREKHSPSIPGTVHVEDIGNGNA